MRSPYVRPFLFFLLPLVLLAAGEAYVRSLPNAAKSKHEFLTKHSDEVDVLVLGSSHTYYGICPDALGSHAYNAAQVSQTLRYDDWLLHHYSFNNIEWVVQPVSDFSLYENLEGGSEWYLANRYRLYMDCDIHSPWSVYGWEATAFPAFVEKLKSLWQPPKMRWSEQGQGLEYTLESRAAEWDNGAERARHNCYENFAAAEENVGHLHRIARFCEKRHARLLLISTPLRPSYRSAQDPRQIADMRHRLKVFLKRHPVAMYLDFSADPRFSDVDFYDADHLNTDGARKLSFLIKQRMHGQNRLK